MAEQARFPRRKPRFERRGGGRFLALDHHQVIAPVGQAGAAQRLQHAGEIARGAVAEAMAYPLPQAARRNLAQFGATPVQ